MDFYTITEILKYILPSIVVLLTAWLMFKTYFKHIGQQNKAEHEEELRKQMLDLKMQHKKDLLPVKLQAFERMILFLERININNLVLRTNQPALSAVEMQNVLVKTIREEYEHNFSQQLYIPERAWKAIKESRDETIKIIVATSSELEPTATGIELNSKLLTVFGQIEESPTDKAIAILRKEFDSSL